MSRDRSPRLAQTERLLYLRTIEAFSELPARDLAAIAEQARERIFEPGERIISAGHRCRRLFMIIQGSVRLERDGELVGTAGRRAGLAVLGVLSQREAPVSALASERTLALEIEREPLMELLSDKLSMLQSILGLLARGLLYHRRRLGHHAGYDDRPDAGLECPAQPLDLVQRLRHLRHTLTFARDHVAALVDLSRHAEEVRVEPGTVLWRQGDHPGWTDLVYCGTIRGEVDADRGEGATQRFYFHDGFAVGAIDNLANTPRWYTATAESTVVALRITAEHLLDLFEDRFDIAHDFLKMVSGELLDLIGRVGGQEGASEDPRPFSRSALLPGAGPKEAS